MYLRNVACLCVFASLAVGSVAFAQSARQGITKPEILPAFNPNEPTCSKPVGLTNELVFVQENERGFLEGVNYGLGLAAKDRGLKYIQALADNDASKAIKHVERSLDSHVGALVATSPDPLALKPSLINLINSGAYVGTIVPPPATLLLNAPQYATGKVLTDTAISYINEKLGGKANVVLLTQDTMEFLAPRFEAMRDGLSSLPGVTIIADIAPIPVDKSGGYATMKTILLANPDIDVVLGSDTVVLGALQALRESHKDRPDQFLGGIDGEVEAVAEIKKGDSPFKASISLSSPVYSYAMGQFAADWLEGKSIPQAMDILPTALTKDNIQQYEADLKNPAAVYKDQARKESYLRMYGNICYDTRDQFINFPWSSEMK